MESIRNTHTIPILIFLTLIAAATRFIDLGALGFYGDEETSSLAARSLAQGGDMAMPSGMPYLRAIPQTLVNALSAKIFGTENEISYRLPAALLGTLTIPLLFLFARTLVGNTTALVAALLLALSEWHIITSREARMYAPFLFFYIATAFALLRWNITGKPRYAFYALVLFAGGATLHPLGTLSVQFAAIPLAFANWSRLKPLPVILFIIVAGLAAHLYTDTMEFSPYDIWKQAHGEVASPVADDTSLQTERFPIYFSAPHYLVYALLAVGGLLGLWIARLCPVHDENPGHWLRKAGLIISATLSGALLSVGHFYAAALAAVLFLIIHPDDRRSIASRIRLPLAALLVTSLIPLFISITQNGIITAIKKALFFPFPYLVYFPEISAGLFISFAVMCAILLFKKPDPEDVPLKASMLAFFLPIIAIGIASQWGGTRYLIEIYPFFLIIAAAGLVRLVQLVIQLPVFRQAIPVLPVVLLLALSGIVGGHGIPQAVLASQLYYGEPFNRHALGFEFYPDHQGPGSYVKKHLEKDDVVIAEDMLEQYWYIGRVDYWLTDKAKSWEYLYHDEQGAERDIYVSSEILTERIRNELVNGNRRIWLITSGETFSREAQYLSPEQIEWLDAIEKSHHPVYTGRDNVSKVYCINC